MNMSDQKLVALTFDDGPTIGITDQVLDVLQENGVVASFFLIGHQITDETRYFHEGILSTSIQTHPSAHDSFPSSLYLFTLIVGRNDLGTISSRSKNHTI